MGEYEHPGWGWLPAVVDFKSGHPRWQVKADSEQLGYHALWLSKMLKVDMVCSLVYRTRDGDINVYLWDSQRLARFEKRMHDLEARLALIDAGLAQPTLVKGKDCTFCGSKPVCSLWAQKGSGDGVP